MEWDGAYYWLENRTIQIHEAIQKRTDGDLEAGDCWCHADCYNSQPRKGTKIYPRNRKSCPHFWRGPGNYIKKGDCSYHDLQISRSESTRYSQFYHDILAWLKTEFAKTTLSFTSFVEEKSTKYSDFKLSHDQSKVHWHETEILIVHKNRKRKPRSDFFIYIDLSQWTKKELADFDQYGVRKLKEEFEQLKLIQSKQIEEEQARIQKIADDAIAEEKAELEIKMRLATAKQKKKETAERKYKLLRHYSITFKEYLDKKYSIYSWTYTEPDPETKEYLSHVFSKIRDYRVTNDSYENYTEQLITEEEEVLLPQLKKRMTTSAAWKYVKQVSVQEKYSKYLAKLKKFNIDKCESLTELEKILGDYVSEFRNLWEDWIEIPFAKLILVEPSYEHRWNDLVSETKDILDIVIQKNHKIWRKENPDFESEYNNKHKGKLMQDLDDATSEERRYEKFAPRSRWAADRRRWGEWIEKVRELTNLLNLDPYSYMRPKSKFMSLVEKYDEMPG